MFLLVIRKQLGPLNTKRGGHFACIRPFRHAPSTQVGKLRADGLPLLEPRFLANRGELLAGRCVGAGSTCPAGVLFDVRHLYSI